MQLTNLKTKYLGQNTIYYETIDSTQSEIWRLYENKNTPNGTLVLSDIQTQGKGTHGRIWHTDQKENIAFSFLVKLDCDAQKLDGITIKIAETIVEIMKDMYEVSLSIKEPNDLILNGKKLGGILTETKVSGNTAKCLVIGIGINLKQIDFAHDIKDIATSIKKETGKEIDRIEFITEFCNRFEKVLEEIQ